MKVMASNTSRPLRAALALLPLSLATAFFLGCPSAGAADTTPPTVSITRPAAGVTFTNGTLAIAGTAHDNVGVANVNYSLNQAAFTTANSTNNWTNWSAVVSLSPGTNNLRVYAADSAGNHSATNSVTFYYLVKATASFVKFGKGTFSTNYNNVPLPLGKTLSVTATAAPGFVFTGWSGSASTTNATLTFVMQPGLTFVANFQDVAPPTVTIQTPRPGQQVADQNFLLLGRASDNLAVASVFYQLNGGGWTPAQTFNSNMNWMASVVLRKGSNFVQAYATDTTGHFSRTNSVSFTFVPPRTWAPDTLAGLLAEVVPNSTVPYRMVFGISTFSESAFGTADFNGLGDYTYTKLTTNTARLTVIFNLPPNDAIGTNVIDLTFGGDDAALYNSESFGSDYGYMNFFATPVLAPINLTNVTIVATTAESAGITLTLATSTFRQRDSNGVKHSGNYTYQKFSPAAGLLTLAYATPADEIGATNYIQLTFTEQGGGNFAISAFNATGNFTGIDSGTFYTMPVP